MLDAAKDTRKVEDAAEDTEKKLDDAGDEGVAGDVEGGVLLLGTAKDTPPDEAAARDLSIAASFLARWMEE